MRFSQAFVVAAAASTELWTLTAALVPEVDGVEAYSNMFEARSITDSFAPEVNYLYARAAKKDSKDSKPKYGKWWAGKEDKWDQTLVKDSKMRRQVKCDVNKKSEHVASDDTVKEAAEEACKNLQKHADKKDAHKGKKFALYQYHGKSSDSNSSDDKKSGDKDKKNHKNSEHKENNSDDDEHDKSNKSNKSSDSDSDNDSHNNSKRDNDDDSSSDKKDKKDSKDKDNKKDKDSKKDTKTESDMSFLLQVKGKHAPKFTQDECVAAYMSIAKQCYGAAKDQKTTNGGIVKLKPKKKSWFKSNYLAFALVPQGSDVDAAKKEVSKGNGLFHTFKPAGGK